jgi:hypothetical protein
MPSDVRVWGQEESRNLSSRRIPGILSPASPAFSIGATFLKARMSRVSVTRRGFKVKLAFRMP